MMKIPSLGLSSIAANVDRDLHEVAIADLLVASTDARKHFQGLLTKYDPDVVGFSVITMQYFEALELARTAKKFKGNIKVVLGGYHPTLDYETILNNDKENIVDFIIRGEAEVSFNELIRSLRKDQDLRKVPNLSYRDKGNTVHNPSQSLLDLDGIKLPDRNVRTNKKGYHLFGYSADIVEMSRGCPYNCSFCASSSMYGRSYRKFAIDRIVEDIKDAKEHGAKAIFVADHNVTAEPKWYKQVCEAIIDAKLNNLRFGVQVDVRGLREAPGLSRVMAESGVAWVLIGIESVSPTNMSFLRKNQFKNTDAVEVVEELKKNGIIVLGTFILGNPDDTEESIKANYEYAKSVGVDVASFLSLTPYPNTAVREELIKKDLVTNLYDYSKYNLTYSNVRTQFLSAEQVFELLKECEAKYLFDSGSIWRLTRKHPFYVAKLFFQDLFEGLIHQPKRSMGYTKKLWPTRFGCTKGNSKRLKAAEIIE